MSESQDIAPVIVPRKKRDYGECSRCGGETRHTLEETSSIGGLSAIICCACFNEHIENPLVRKLEKDKRQLEEAFIYHLACVHGGQGDPDPALAEANLRQRELIADQLRDLGRAFLDAHVVASTVAKSAPRSIEAD